VINPSILEPQPTFEIVDMSVSKSGLIDWTTTGESGSLPYIVQQFKWNKWVRIGEIEGKGTPGKNSYSFQAVEVSGTNKFRVIQKNSNGVFKSSNSVQFQSFKEDVTVVYDKKQSALKFSSETNFELYNIYGQIVKRGFGSEVDLAAFRKDEYYINFDNQSEKFFKK
jgi:hypothetical protein